MSQYAPFLTTKGLPVTEEAFDLFCKDTVCYDRNSQDFNQKSNIAVTSVRFARCPRTVDQAQVANEMYVPGCLASSLQ